MNRAELPQPQPRSRVHDEPEFSALMAEQLRRTPWLALSVLIHAAAVLILMLLPPPERRIEEHRVSLLPSQEQPVPPPEVLQPPPTKVDTPPEPHLQDSELPEPDSPEPEPADFADVPFSSREALPAGTTNIGLLGERGGPYGRRSGRGPGGGGGGGRPVIETVDRALEWLARHQDADGRWDADGFMKHDDLSRGRPCGGPGNPVHDVGVTGLALLAFLADNNTLRAGRYRDNVRRAVLWLRSQQGGDGLFGGRASHDFVYDHAIAAYAMVEAYGLSDYRTLRPYAQRGLDYLAAHRNPYGVWRYQPRDNDNDSSVTGWCVLALASGKHFGLQVDGAALRDAGTWFDAVTTEDGRCGYTRPGEPSSRQKGDHGARFPPEKGEALTAVGLFSRFFLGQRPDEQPRMVKAADRILEKPPVWDVSAGTIDHYYWYYATYALYQMGGRHWKAWSRSLNAAVIDTQRRDGNHEGSWDPAGAWGEEGGRVYSTALLTLTLQAYWRYTRLVR